MNIHAEIIACGFSRVLWQVTDYPDNEKTSEVLSIVVKIAV